MRVAAGGAARRRRRVRRARGRVAAARGADRAAGPAPRRLAGRLRRRRASSTFDEPLYSVGTGNNPEYDATALQVVFESLVTPRTVYDYDVATGELHPAQAPAGARRLRPGDVRAAPRVGHRAPTAPGCRSRWCYRRGTSSRTAPRPGCSTATAPTRSPSTRTSPWPGSRCSTAASSTRSPTSAAAARWAGAGTTTASCDRKLNTFTDFIACADHLVETGWVAPDRLVAEGGSAGGLLIGAVANLAPDRFRAVARRGAVRRRADHDAGPVAAADRAGVGGVGQPAARPRGLRATCAPTRRTRTSPRGDYPAILATTSLNDTRVLLRRAGQVGRAAARDGHQRPGRAPDPAAHRDGGRPRRPQRAVRRLEAVRLGARLPDGPGGRALSRR